jgi:hypothetical protein
MRRMPDSFKVIDGVWVTLRGDGTVGVPVIDTVREDISDEYMRRIDVKIHVRPKGDPRKGRGNRATLWYLNAQFEADGILPGDHCTLHFTSFFIYSLIFRSVWRDNERALNNSASKSVLRRNRVHSWNFKEYMGAYTDPCDNNFNSSYRSRFDSNASLVNSDRPLSGDVKMEMLRSSYYDFDPESVRGYFRKTGLIGDEEPRTVISNLINEATGKIKEKFDRLYRHQLEIYVTAARKAGVVLHEGGGLIGPWWDVIRSIK